MARKNHLKRPYITMKKWKEFIENVSWRVSLNRDSKAEYDNKLTELEKQEGKYE